MENLDHLEGNDNTGNASLTVTYVDEGCIMEKLDHLEGNDNTGNGNDNTGNGDFYKDAADYWAKVPPTVDGMLGGYGFISSIDVNGSHQFLKRLYRVSTCIVLYSENGLFVSILFRRFFFQLKNPPGKSRALDCGAGIGRVTKNLLFNHFEKVDLVEQNPAFVDQARASLQSHIKMGNFYCSG